MLFIIFPCNCDLPLLPLPAPPSGFQHVVKLFIMQPRSCCEAEEAQGLLSASHPTTGTTRALGVLQNLLSASNRPSATFLGHYRGIPARSHTLPATCWLQERPHTSQSLWDFPAAKEGTSTAGKLCSVAWKSPLQEPDLLVMINLQQIDDGSPGAVLVTDLSLGAEDLQDLTAPQGSV